MIYVSGKMTGEKDLNYPKFNRVTKELRDRGHIVVNPAEIAQSMDTNDYEEIMNADLRALEKCTIIYLLNGWNNSSGAKRELKRALELRLKVFMEGEFVQ